MWIEESDDEEINDDDSDGNGDTNIKEVMCMINANFYCGLKNRQECCS